MNLTQNIWHTEIEYQCKSIYRENIQKSTRVWRKWQACGISCQFDQLCPILTNEVLNLFYCVKNIIATTQNHVLMYSLEQYNFWWKDMSWTFPCVWWLQTGRRCGLPCYTACPSTEHQAHQCVCVKLSVGHP